MYFYRISLVGDADSQIIEGLIIAKNKVTWVQSSKTVDAHRAWDRGVAVKKLDKLPETDINGDKITAESI